MENNELEAWSTRFAPKCEYESDEGFFILKKSFQKIKSKNIEDENMEENYCSQNYKNIENKNYRKTFVSNFSVGTSKNFSIDSSSENDVKNVPIAF